VTLPTVQEARALHEKYAPTREALDLVYTHCEIICRIAEQLMARAVPQLDTALVRAGALLHDIGVYRLYDHDGRLDHSSYIRHGVLGHEILRREGLPERLRRFCSCHTGVGLTRHDIREQRLDLPVADYVAVSVEERLVMYADKFHSKTTPPKFLSADLYTAYLQRFGSDKVSTFHRLQDQFGEPDLTASRDEFGHRQAGPASARCGRRTSPGSTRSTSPARSSPSSTSRR
jgi:uncharacterized protein